MRYNRVGEYEESARGCFEPPRKKFSIILSFAPLSDPCPHEFIDKPYPTQYNTVFLHPYFIHSPTDMASELS